MKTSRLARSVALASFLGTALVGGATLDAALPEEAEAGYDIDESYFYGSLSGYGSWVQNAQFGWVWYPNQRSANWRPYTVGQWVWTDYGEWMWVSAEPYGWATYHYGRWFLDPFYGWVWLPGRVWAPAWVSWRGGNDYIGWAPLGPWGYWDSGRNCYRDRYYRGHYDGDYDDGNHHNGRPDDGGYHDGDYHDGDHHGGRDDNDRDYSGDRRYHENQDTWNFARKRDFASARVDKVVLDRKHVPEAFGKARDLPPPSVDDERLGRGTTRAIDKTTIERAAGRPIRPVKVEDSDAPTKPGKRDSGADRVRVYRPKVSESKPGARTPDKLGIAKQTDRAGRPAPGRAGGVEPADKTSRDGKPVRTERPDRMNQNTPARGAGATREPRLPGKESPAKGRGNSGEPANATKPMWPKSPEIDDTPRGGAGGEKRPGKPDTGARERPAREDERGGYERPGRPTDSVGYVRPDGNSGRSDAAKPARSSEPSGSSRTNKQPTYGQQPSKAQPSSRGQQPTRSQQPAKAQERSYPQQPMYGQQPSRTQQPSHGQQPSKMQQPSHGQQPSKMQQPSHGQQPSRSSQPQGSDRHSYDRPSQQPSHGGSGSSPSRQSAPQPTGSPSSYQRPSSPSGGGGGSQGRAPSSPSQGSSSQGQGSRGGGGSHGGGASSPGGSSGGRSGGGSPGHN